jgi:hypothetical protein
MIKMETENDNSGRIIGSLDNSRGYKAFVQVEIRGEQYLSVVNTFFYRHDDALRNALEEHGISDYRLRGDGLPAQKGENYSMTGAGMMAVNPDKRYEKQIFYSGGYDAYLLVPDRENLEALLAEELPDWTVEYKGLD